VITTQQAQVLLTALLQTSAAGPKQRADAWPALLELLGRFAAVSGQLRSAAGELLPSVAPLSMGLCMQYPAVDALLRRGYCLLSSRDCLRYETASQSFS
jgi:hypothetical protein